MSHVENNPGVHSCDECGRRTDDPEIIVSNYDHRTEPITYKEFIKPGWARLSFEDTNLGFDLCPVCLNMKFGHLLKLYAQKRKVT